MVARQNFAIKYGIVSSRFDSSYGSTNFSGRFQGEISFLLNHNNRMNSTIPQWTCLPGKGASWVCIWVLLVEPSCLAPGPHSQGHLWVLHCFRPARTEIPTEVGRIRSQPSDKLSSRVASSANVSPFTALNATCRLQQKHTVVTYQRRY